MLFADLCVCNTCFVQSWALYCSNLLNCSPIDHRDTCSTSQESSIHTCMPVPVLHHSLLKLHISCLMYSIYKLILYWLVVRRICSKCISSVKCILLSRFSARFVKLSLITRVHLFIKSHIMQIREVQTDHSESETAGTTDVGQCCHYHVPIVSTAVFTLQSYTSAHWYRGSKCLCIYV